MPVDVIIATPGDTVTFAGFPVSAGIIPAGVPDSNGPTITTIVPPVGTTIQPEDRVEFDVVDTVSGLGFVFIIANFESSGVGCSEVVYSSGQLGPRYLALSSVTEITDGLRFYLRRVGGWPGDVVLTITAYDSSLQSATVEVS